ncbi:hypothetical protein GJ904_17770 [Salmonella enterica]|nr:hypothetical protein [Salmonella enterica subsp. enterica serovar Saintpaul]EEC1302921.1 hypothetical protein [Salmonella enterica]
MSQFDELMATLNAIDAEAPAEELVKSEPAGEEIVKALPKDEEADDKKIAAAEGEGKGEGDDEEEEGEDKGEEFDKSCGSMKKSLVNEEGEELIDATEILEGLQKSFAEHDDVLAKAMPKVVEHLAAQSKQLKEQGELIKSMQETIATLGARGTGRKSMVTVLAKSSVAAQPAAATAQEPEAPTAQDIMVKANSLFDQKLLSGLQLTKLDVALRNGYTPDADILAVLAKH